VERYSLIRWPVCSTAAATSHERLRCSRPFVVDAYRGPGLSRFYRQQIVGKNVLIVDDVRNTGQTLARCATIVRSAGGKVLATAELYDRMEATVDAAAPNVALAEYKAP
jgi:hypoxanthine phosphoribosyltransferase